MSGNPSEDGSPSRKHRVSKYKSESQYTEVHLMLSFLEGSVGHLLFVIWFPGAFTLDFPFRIISRNARHGAAAQRRISFHSFIISSDVALTASDFIWFLLFAI